jgi:hypothetical protein
MLLCPSCACTVLRSIPAQCARPAAPCHRSCSRTGGSPDSPSDGGSGGSSATKDGNVAVCSTVQPRPPAVPRSSARLRRAALSRPGRAGRAVAQQPFADGRVQRRAQGGADPVQRRRGRRTPVPLRGRDHAGDGPASQLAEPHPAQRRHAAWQNGRILAPTRRTDRTGFRAPRSSSAREAA